MEQRQSNKISFKGQNIYVGLDVHLKSWSVTILSETSVLKQYRQDASPEALHKTLTTNYPDAEYHSVYEASPSISEVSSSVRRRHSSVNSAFLHN